MTLPQSGAGAAVKVMNSSHQMADSTVNESAKVQQALENILGAVGMIVDQTGRSLLPPKNRLPWPSDIDPTSSKSAR
jgi:methyl-accepting chemotaxis protein